MAFASINQASVSGGSSNALSIQSDGIFMPRLSTGQRTALALTTSDAGLTVYDFTLNNLFIWNGTAWESIPGSGDAGANGSVQYNDNGIVSGATNFTYNKATSAVSIAGALTLTGGTANGVPYLNASKVVTTGTNLSFANTPGFFDSTLNINSLLGSALYRGGITVSEDNTSFTLFGGSGYKLIQASGFSTPNELIFYVSNAEAARFKSSGNLAFPDAKGIDFSAKTPDGSGTVGSEVLNDYEEGTWTIGLVFGAGSTGITTSANTGRYTKIGRQVTVTGNLSLTSKGSSTGSASITGLPFTIANTDAAYSAPSIRFNAITYVGAFQSIGNINGTSFNLEQISTLGSVTAITDANFSNSSGVVFSFTYTV